MLTKRLCKQWSFILILCMIPIVVMSMTIAMSGESGVLHIVLYDDDGSKTSKDIIDRLTSNKSVLRFSVCNSRQAATEYVKTDNADAAWIFNKDLETLIDNFVNGKSSPPPVEIFEKEETIPLKISKEILFGAIYKEASYRLYFNYSLNNLVTINESITKNKIKSSYDNITGTHSIVEFKKLSSESVSDQSNILTAPIRGILSLIVLLCSLSASLYFLNDKKKACTTGCHHKKEYFQPWLLAFPHLYFPALQL